MDALHRIKGTSCRHGAKKGKNPALDFNHLSYHGIRKLAAIPNATPKCIPMESSGKDASYSNNKMASAGTPPFSKKLYSTGSPPLSPNLEENSSGYSPLLTRSLYIGSGVLDKKATKKKLKKATENGIIGVLAAQTLKIASINGLGELDKLEHDLEEELDFDNRSDAKTLIGKFRRQGHHHLHGKAVLLVVVLLNIIDCVLVMGELVLDFHHVSHLLQNKKAMIDSFTDNLKRKYSPNLDAIVKKERHYLLQDIIDASIVWQPDRHVAQPGHAHHGSVIETTAATNVTLAASQCYSYVQSAATFNNQSLSAYVTSLPPSDWLESQPLSSCFQPLVDLFRTTPSSSSGPAPSYNLSSLDHRNEKLIVVAHKLHYISVAILSILVVILFLKIWCAGKRFFKSKMQVFDGVVILISFIVDLVFIKGVTIFQTNDFVIILTFLLPWRIIRVLNSLIAAVLDKQRLNLKIIYTQKKKISRNLSEVNNKVDVMQRQIQVLQGLCSSRGLNDGDVRKVLGTEKHDKSEKHHESSSSSSKKHASGHGLASMMALGKLAFQAADALAPMPDYKAGKSSAPASPVSTPLFNGVQKDNDNTNTSTPTPPTTNGVVHKPANGTVPKVITTTPTTNDHNNDDDTGNPRQSKNNPNHNNNNNENENAGGLGTTSSPSPSPNNHNHQQPEVVSCNSPSLDNDESMATISMDLRDDSDVTSVDEVKVDMGEDFGQIPFADIDGVTDDMDVVNDSNATSRL